MVYNTQHPMRSFLLLALTLLLPFTHLRAQLLAGEVPDGTMAYQVGIDLSLTTSFSADSADLEFDCDDFMDGWARLYRGAPEVDAPNFAMLDFLDDNVEVCMDMTSGFAQRPKYHAFGEPLDCSGDFEWQLADELYLGDYGGFGFIGPWEVDSLYIAYRQGGAMGWILLSFELSGETVDLQIHELLSLCQLTNGMEEGTATATLTLYPNPGNGGPIRVESNTPLQGIELLDATGRLIAQYGGNTRTIEAPGSSGSYLLRATHADGRRSVLRFVQQ